MILPRRFVGVVRRACLGGLLMGLWSSVFAADDAFVGRWALTIPGGDPGWLEIRSENGRLTGSLMWARGYVNPVLNLTLTDGELTFTRTREEKTKNAKGKMVNTQKPFATVTARVKGDDLTLMDRTPRAGGQGFNEREFTGRRVPAMPPPPDLSKAKFGEPIALLNDRDLAGWKPIPAGAENAWVFENGILSNRAVEAQGQPVGKYANLRTEREFEDFNLKLEVKTSERCDSGVFLRGIYEVQVFDSFERPLTAIKSTGALHSRIPPMVRAEKPRGEWQTMDITLLDRHVTVVLNGTVVIDNQPVAGCTGGALWSDETRPGPIYLQGDHTSIEFRHLVLRPIVK